MSKDSIRLHPKYGVNPTIARCFWCGEDRNDIALLGAAYDGRAPMHMVIDYEPCDKCKAGMALGITVIEAKVIDHNDRRGRKRQIQPEVVPTGRWVVVTEDAIRRWITPTELADQTIEVRKAFMDVESFSQLATGIDKIKEP